MKQELTIIFSLVLIVSALFYFGGYALLVGLGVVGLTTIIFLSFAFGARWSRNLMREGAQIAIQATNNNDRNDATKIQALSHLTREAIKAKIEAQRGNFPALPPFTYTEGSFTIAGLEDADIEQYSDIEGA